MSKTVILHYIEDRTSKTKKLSVKPEHTLKDINSFIVQNISAFKNTSFFYLYQFSNKHFNKVDENISISSFNQPKKIHLSVFPNVVNLTILLDDAQPKLVEFHLNETVFENLKRIVPEMPEFCVFAYLPEPNHEFYKITALSLLLPEQGWAGESLVLIRRAILADSILYSDPMKVRQLFEHCLRSLRLGISIYSPVHWGSLVCLQYIARGGQIRQFSHTELTKMLPEYLKADESVVKAAAAALSKYKHLTPPSAVHEYVELSIRFDAQCAFHDRVKFSIENSKWPFMRERDIYFSPTSILVTKQNGQVIKDRQYVSNITQINCEGDLLYITFSEEIKWKIKSQHQQLLISIIDDLRNIVKELPQEINDDVIYSDDEELGIPNSSSNPLLKADSSVEDFQQQIEDQPVIEEEGIVEILPEPRHIVEVPVQLGISKMICCSPDEVDEPYSTRHLLGRDLKIIKQLPPDDENESTGSIEKIQDIAFYYSTGGYFSIHETSTQILLAIIILIFIYLMI